MTDKTQPPIKAQPPSDTKRDTENDVGDDASDHRQRIFDERFAAVTNGFGQACEQHKIEIAIAIAMHPQESQPIIFIRGHHYDAASLLARVLKSLKTHLYNGLDAEPRVEDMDA